MTPRIEYLSQGPQGRFLYIGPEGVIQFSYDSEFPGCVLNVNVPTAHDWERETKIPSNSREPILKFIGHFLVKEQLIDCNYELNDTSIQVKQLAAAPSINSHHIVKFIGLLLILAGLLMQVFDISFTGTYLARRGGWTTSTISGLALIAFGLVFFFYKTFKKKNQKDA